MIGGRRLTKKHRKLFGRHTKKHHNKHAKRSMRRRKGKHNKLYSEARGQVCSGKEESCPSKKSASVLRAPRIKEHEISIHDESHNTTSTLTDIIASRREELEKLKVEFKEIPKKNTKKREKLLARMKPLLEHIKHMEMGEEYNKASIKLTEKLTKKTRRTHRNGGAQSCKISEPKCEINMGPQGKALYISCVKSKTCKGKKLNNRHSKIYYPEGEGQACSAEQDGFDSNMRRTRPVNDSLTKELLKIEKSTLSNNINIILTSMFYDEDISDEEYFKFIAFFTMPEVKESLYNSSGNKYNNIQKVNGLLNNYLVVDINYSINDHNKKLKAFKHFETLLHMAGSDFMFEKYNHSMDIDKFIKEQLTDLYVYISKENERELMEYIDFGF